MTCTSPVIVDAISNSVKVFKGVTSITIGRNVNSSIDIPSTSISRHQCIIKLNENQQWIIKDLSSHKSSLVNNKRIDQEQILSNGDKITFLHYSGSEFFFYYSSDLVPSIFKKRKPDDSDQHSLYASSSPLKKVLKTKDSSEEDEILTPTPILCASPIKSGDIDKLSNELEKYKLLYQTTLQDLTGLKKEKSIVCNELASVTEKLKTVTSQTSESIALLEKEKEILKDKLKKEEETKEKMVLEIQELNECLKESELEQQRLVEEVEYSKVNEALSNKEPLKGESLLKDENEKKEKEDDYFSALSLQKIVDLVEVQWNEVEMTQLKSELKRKDEQITDLTLDAEKHKQEIVDIIDRELLCSICSDVLYDAITLNCKHTFCKACVIEWKTKKKECPVCRTKIKSEVHPLVIDSFIDRILDSVGGELKTRRAEVKAERNKSAMNAPSTSKGGNGRRGGYQPRTPRRGRGANIPTISAAMGVLQPQLVIDLMDIGADMVPPGIIDLTTTQYTRRGRSRTINYFNL